MTRCGIRNASPLGFGIAVFAIGLAFAAPSRAATCADVRDLLQRGLSTEEVASATGLSGAMVGACLNGNAGIAGSARGPAGRAPHGAAGPAPHGAAGPAPLGAAGPAPHGAAGPAPFGPGVNP
jgi:hypothetical protein